MVRSALRMLLDAEADLEVVAEAGDVDTTAALRPRPPPRRPHPRPEHARRPEPAGDPGDPARPRRSTQIVVLTMQSDPVFAREAMQSGVLGYILKDAADSELVNAVRLAADGETYLQPELGARLAAEPMRPARRPLRAGGRDPAPDRTRPHQRRDRRVALPQRPHRRVAPRPHPAEAADDASAPSSCATRSTATCSRPEAGAPAPRRVARSRSPGFESTSSSPPASSTRSRIPSMPKPSPGRPWDRTPRPSSRTTISIRPSDSVSEQATFSAWACLTTLVRASWTTR